MIYLPATKEKIFYSILIGFVLLFIFTTFKFATGYEKINHDRSWQSRKEHMKRENVDMIRDWMTFSYVNKVYNLPFDYLKTELSITNKKYPNMIIDEQNLDMVKSAVSSFDNRSQD